MRETRGQRPPPSAELMRFHILHGSSITLSEGRNVASRNEGAFGNGIVFSALPVQLNQKLCLELTRVTKWSGALRFGVTTQDPDRLAVSDLPRYVCPDLTNKEGYWARALPETLAASGNRITFYVNGLGQMHYFVNNEHKGILLNHLPTNQTLWGLFDIYGNTSNASFVPPDAAPVEILARGPDAMRAYHKACEQGTQPVFRTRLMLVGQGRVGKTSLKRALTGQGHNASEESTDGIDLSASCSFNLRERKAWKVAVSGGGGDGSGQKDTKHDTHLQTPGGRDSIEEEYNQAIASNIVHELLHRQHERNVRQASIDKEEPDSTGTPTSSSTITNKGIIHTNYKDKKRKEGVQVSLSEDMHQYTPLSEMPERVVQLVQKMVTEREQNETLTLTTSGMTTRQGAGGEDAVSSKNGKQIVLNIWDFAGQAAYYTTHQVFLSSRAVYIIVFNMCHELDDLIKTRTKKSVTEAENDKSELSSFDYMNFWMNSIHVHTAQNTRNSLDNTTLSPPIFIVGTHRNALHDDPEIRDQMVKEKLEAIRRTLHRKPYQRHVIPRFYAVENQLSNAEDEQVARLRRDIEEVASREPYMGEQMPIKWLRFEQAITKLVDEGTYFASLGQIREVAKEVGITQEEEMNTLLEFYHDLGVIIFYGIGSSTLDNVLRNIVILKPQWLVDMFKRIITTRDLDQQWGTYRDLWQRLDTAGLLEEKLIDYVWQDVIDQKAALLGLMDKFDLICERRSNNMTVRRSIDQGRTFYVPSRLRKCPDTQRLYTPSDSDVIFYLDFCGFLPDGLFHRVLTRCIRWTDECGGHEPQLFYRKAKFFLDSEHDFVVEMAPVQLARIKVSVLRMADLDESDDSSSDDNEDKPMPPPKPTACAKVRNFLESILSELRELWMKRISYHAVVKCQCDKPCVDHARLKCTEDVCSHFLNLDECLSNKIVLCEHRRIKTAPYRKWFPAPVPVARQGPVLPESVVNDLSTQVFGNIEATKGHELPGWVKSAAKLLNGGSEGQDWTALAEKLGYKKSLEKFADDLNPGLALITDWIVSSGNTALSIDMLVACLEQMMREDIVEIIQKGRESEVAPPQVFVSYQWDVQDEVNALRNKLEKCGYTCWMDIGQMGGGDQLYARVEEAIRNAKLVIACVTPKYVTSHYCNRELSLADLLRKPIIPVMYEKVPWPPPGGMALIFSQLVYINMKGIGGHGGSGIHADLESKYQEIMQRTSCFATPEPRPEAEDSSGTTKACLDHSDSSDTSPVNSPDHVITDPLVISAVGRALSTGSRRRRGTGGDPPEGGGGTDRGRDGGSAGTGRSGDQPRLVEEVHVTKCAVCTIL